MSKSVRALALVIALGVTTACSGGGAGSAGAPTPTTGAASADAEPVAEGENGVLRVAGTGLSYPHSYMENGELVGFETDVIEEAATRSGYTVEFTTMDFPGLLPAVSAGRIDTSASNVTWTPERGETFVFSSAYAFDGVALVARADDADIQDQADLEGGVISTGAGTTNEAAVRDWMETTGTTVDLRSFETADAAMQELLVGRADALAGPSGASIARGANQGVPLRQVGDLLTFEQTRFPFADTDRGRELAQQISDSIEEMKADGTLTEFSLKYFPTDRTQPTNPAHEEPAAAEITTPGGSS